MGFAIFFIIISTSLAILGISVHIKQEKELEQKRKQEIEKFNREHPHYQEESFYRECVKLGILNAAERANIARINLCAKNLSLNLNEETGFYEGLVID